MLLKDVKLMNKEVCKFRVDTSNARDIIQQKPTGGIRSDPRRSRDNSCPAAERVPLGGGADFFPSPTPPLPVSRTKDLCEVDEPTIEGSQSTFAEEN